MEIKNVLIAGGGMMGKNIAFVFSSNPAYDITVYDLFPTDVYAGIRKNTEPLGLSEEELESRLSRISFTTDLDSDLIKKADLVIEAVFEDMKVKRETFAKLEERCRPDTIFCTNTSVMSPSEISAELKYRERFVGTHFWNPGHLIPLVEVVKSDATSDECANTVMEVLAAVGKEPVLCKKDVPGCMRFAMKPGTSFLQRTGFLPTFARTSITVFAVSSEEASLLTTSTRGIRCAGFQK